MKTRLLLAVSAFLAVIFAVTAVKSETITMRTWYPSPYGSYQRLKASDFLTANKVVFEPRAEAPVSPSTGTVYYDASLTCLRVYTENGWVNIGKANYLAVVYLPNGYNSPLFSNNSAMLKNMPMSIARHLSADEDTAKILLNATYGDYLRIIAKSTIGKADYTVKSSGTVRVVGQGTANFVVRLYGAGGVVYTSPKYTDTGGVAVKVDNPNEGYSTESWIMTESLDGLPSKCYGVTSLTGAGAAYTYNKRLAAKATSEIIGVTFSTTVAQGGYTAAYLFPTYRLMKNADRDVWQYGILYQSNKKPTAATIYSGTSVIGWTDVGGPGNGNGPDFKLEEDAGDDPPASKPVKNTFKENITLSAAQLEECKTIVAIGPMSGVLARGQVNYTDFFARIQRNSAKINVWPEDFTLTVSVE